MILGHRKSIRQFALIAAANVKFHSGQKRAGLSDAQNVIENSKDSDSLDCWIFLIIYFLFF